MSPNAICLEEPSANIALKNNNIPNLLFSYFQNLGHVLSLLLQASDVINQTTLFFRDGQRRIDFVLAYHDEEVVGGDAEQAERMRARRQTFEENLCNEGFELEYEKKEVMYPLSLNTFKLRFYCVTKLFCSNTKK